MDEKTKLIIIIALAAVLAVSIFLNLQTYGSKKALEQELGYSKAENASLNKKIGEMRQDSKKLEEKINSLNSDLNKLAQDREDVQKQKEELQKQYDIVAKDRDNLVEKLKAGQPRLGAGTQSGPGSSAMAEDNYWAGVLKTKTEVEMQLKSIQASNEQLKMEKNALELDFNSLTHEKQDLEQQLQYHKKMVDDLSTNFVQEKNARFQTQDKLTALKGENAVLRKQLNSLNNTKAKLEKKLAQLSEEKSGLERKFTEMELFLKERLSSLNDARQQLDVISGKDKVSELQNATKEAVELPPIVVSNTQTDRQSGPDDMAGIPRCGSVVTVNKENNFVIIDLGEDAAVKVGDTFRVYRGSQQIANLEVIQTRRDISACDIKKEITPIKAGDSIK